MSTAPRSSAQPPENSATSSIGLVVFAWLFVGLPLAWGVVQTVIKSMALFH